MFGDSSKEVFNAVPFLRTRVAQVVPTTSSGPQRELAFVPGKARVAPIKVMAVQKLKLHAALLVARMRQDACRGITL